MCALSLDVLDRSLGPLRRVVSYALDGHHVRWLGVNGRRFVDQALQQDLPGPMREQVSSLGGLLDGFDEAPDQAVRIQALYQQLVRIDAQLGLPLADPAPLQRHRLRRPARSGRSGPKRTAVQVVEAAPAPAPVVVASLPRFWGGRLDLPIVAIAPELAPELERSGMFCVRDLLDHAPLGHELLEQVHGAGRELPEGRGAISGRVLSWATVFGPRGAYSVVVLEGAAPARVRFKGLVPGWVPETMAEGERAVFAGTVEGGVLCNAELATEQQKAVRLATYGLEGVDDADLRALVLRLLGCIDSVRDPLESSTRKRLSIPSLSETYLGLHWLGQHQQRRRLAYEEALALQLGLGLPRHRTTRDRGIVHPAAHSTLSLMGVIGEITFSDSLERVLDDIKRDMREQSPMQRLITGVPGAGKGTLVLAAIAMATQHRSQVVVLSPDVGTSALRYALAEPLLHRLGLVARAVDSEPRKAIRDALRRGELHVLFAPREVLDASVEFRRLGLVIGEEREEWGATASWVAQRKPPLPDVLVQASVPPPTEVLVRALRTFDVSFVDGPGCTGVASRHDPVGRLDAYRAAATAVKAGSQALVLFPVARDGGGDVLDLREAGRVMAALETQAFAGLRIGLYHGANKREDRSSVLQRFRAGQLDVLVGTARLEDLAPVPRVKVAVVEQADRVDGVRLRRLLALLGDGYELHLVVGEQPDEAGQRRVDALVAGHLPQPVAPESTMACPSLHHLDLVTDEVVVREAREEAGRVLRRDPSLREPCHADLARLVVERWGSLWPDQGPACPIKDAPGSGRRRRRRRKK